MFRFWKVVVGAHCPREFQCDDDYHSFDNAIEILTSFLPLCNSLRAEQIAQIVHTAGECHIHTGFPPEIYIMYAQLQKSGLTIKLKIGKK